MTQLQSWPTADTDAIVWESELDGCQAFRREGGGILCMINTSPRTVPLPDGEILLASGPLDGRDLPPDTAVWLQDS